MTLRHSNTMRLLPVACLLMALLAAPAAAQSDVELGGRYVDPLHGFSLRPPADTQRVRQSSPSRLVTWQQRDPETGAIAWTFTVMEAIERSGDIDLDVYAKALAEKLRAEDRFNVASTEIEPVAGKPAIHLRGVTGGGIRLWQRQVWTLAQPRRFLIFLISGPETKKAELDALCDRILATVQVVDPTAARERRRQALERGQKLLSRLTAKDLADVVEKVEPQWFLVQMKDRTVGFMWQSAGRETWDDTAGFAVRNVLLVRLAEDRPRRMWRRMFVTPDRALGHWQQRLEVGTDEDAVTVMEEGLKQGDRIVATVRSGQQTKSHDQKVPKDIYLPEALGALLPRLVDLSEKVAYGFARYDPRSNSFEMRVFTVRGPEDVTLDGKKVKAVNATDQAAADAEPATLLLDAGGNLLRMQTAEGLVMEASTASAVAKRFPEARSMVAKMKN
jgi:hypothetical protein